MSENILNSLSAKDVGKRIRAAREKGKITQASAAAIIDVARTTMVAIEKGERQVKPNELLMLSRAFNISVSDLLNKNLPTKSFDVQFRASPNRTAEENNEIKGIINDWQQLCLEYFELENILDKPLIKNYPNEYPTDNISYQILAETIAARERIRLGLGDNPIRGIREILEEKVGLRIFFIEMPTKFSEIYAYDEQLGGCLAINSNHPEVRQRWSMSHGYLHFLAHRNRLIYHYQGQYQKYPESEKLADLFAMHFLMPTSSVSEQFMNHKQKNKFSIADLVRLAHHFGVGVQTICQRLEGLKFLPTGTWEDLKSRGIRVGEAQTKLNLNEGNRETKSKFPIRYQFLALEALELGKITESRFSKLLDVNRLEARKIRNILLGEEE